jgi:hypothetical protein
VTTGPGRDVDDLAAHAEIAQHAFEHAAFSPSSCISRSAPMAPGSPSMLRTGALVAWLSEGSCTDQVASATAMQRQA